MEGLLRYFMHATQDIDWHDAQHALVYHSHALGHDLFYQHPNHLHFESYSP